MSFPMTKLAEVTEKIGSGITPRGGDSVYVSEGTSLIRSQNVYNSQFDQDGLAFIDEKTAQKMKGVTVQKDDVLLNITGDSVARCCKADERFLPARVNQHVAIIRPKKSILNSDFLMFYLTSPYMQTKMLSWAGSGGTRKALTKGMIEGFEVPTPDIGVQANISEILKNYNDLIENNKRRIELLEESARQLYKEWFVRFRFPGHEHVKIIDGVPEGWERLTIGNAPLQIVDGDRGKNYPKQDELLNSGFCLFLSAKNVTKSGFNFSECQFITEAKDDTLRKGKLSRDDVVMTTRGTIGNTAYFNKNVHYDNLRINSGMVIFRTDNKRITPSFLYQYLRSDEFISLVHGLKSGVAQPQLPIRDIKTIEILLPSSALMEQFDNICKPNHEQISALNNYSQRLLRTRDLLLPKLISGDIAV